VRPDGSVGYPAGVRMFLLAAGAGLLGPSVLAAQAPAATQAAPPQDARVYDFVAAMVGSKAILASQVTDLWREELRDDLQRQATLRKYESAAKRHALWGQLLETLVMREITAQSAKLMGRSPEEVEEQVQRLVQDELARQAEENGGLNAFARTLGSVGRSMGSVAEDVRADIMQQMAYYQGVLRELHDQRALLATPKEMKALFDADPARFGQPGTVRLAVKRVALGDDPAAARAEAATMAAAWASLPRPVTEAAMRGAGAEGVISVTIGKEGTPAVQAFSPTCQVGDVSAPTEDHGWIWLLLCLERTEAKKPDFRDPGVQAGLLKEIENKRWWQIASRLFPEERVGVKRQPWGEPAAMEQPRR